MDKKFSKGSVIPFDYETAEASATVEKVEVLKSGGLYSHLKGYKYAFKGFPSRETVEAICIVKKLLKSVVPIIQMRRVQLLMGFILILPKRITRPVFVVLIDSILDLVVHILDKFYQESNKYCVTAREVYRIFNETSDRTKGKIIKARIRRIRDIVCLILEFDNAYRFRFQDIMGDLNLENLKKNQRKEILRLMDIMISRELMVNMKEKWTFFRKALSLILLFYKLDLGTALDEVGLEKLKLDEGDKYYCATRSDYNFYDKTYEERLHQRHIEDGTVSKEELERIMG